MRIGIISDTHGLLRPEAVTALKSCDRLIHAGDIGKAEVLDALRELAPLDAIRGNVDSGEWAAEIPERLDLQLGGLRIHVLHDLKELELNPADAGIAVVIAGHSHQPKIEQIDGVLYINPGSAGRRRFTLPISLALLDIEDGQPRPQLVTLG
ncbi:MULTISPECIES: metallophosphoesterase family protein [Pseudomonadaceae]|uniref:metallophosphoesterase family protein n=1 Tax=Pseudomonadaceae TaxID=135621 RepID=UPI0015E43FE1|nr:MULTISPECIES: metallophosphoesterase family protein [Pseudomonadaceae]MBA1276435.1 metallophosphoesterase family protein [Stutzerimonas stutzeri]MBC8648941.1 metallophosphoesterase family protein [Pseudomonas sp. MT4]QXY92906.1 metallophosphoesterase family protein [Pseudomonas sp. MTM4]